MSILAVNSIIGNTVESDVSVGVGDMINLGAGTVIGDMPTLGSNKRHIALAMTTENVVLESDSEHGTVSLHMPYDFTLTEIKIGLSAANGNMGDGNPGDGDMVVTFGDEISSIPNLIIRQGFGATMPVSSGVLNPPLSLDMGHVVSADLDLAQPFIGGSGMKLYLIGNLR